MFFVRLKIRYFVREIPSNEPKAVKYVAIVNDKCVWHTNDGEIEESRYLPSWFESSSRYKEVKAPPCSS